MPTETYAISKKGELFKSSFTPLGPPIKEYPVWIPIRRYVVIKDFYKCIGCKNKEKIAFNGDTLVVIEPPVKIIKYEGELSCIFIVESAKKSKKRDNVIWCRPKKEIERHCGFSVGIVRKEALQVGNFGEILGCEYCFSLNFGCVYNAGNPARVLISTEYYNTVMVPFMILQGYFNTQYFPNENILASYNKLTGTWINHPMKPGKAQGSFDVGLCLSEGCELCRMIRAQTRNFSPESFAQEGIGIREEEPNVSEQGEAQEGEEVGEAKDQ